MRKWTKSAGILFMAAASAAYPLSAVAPAANAPAGVQELKPANDDPFAPSAPSSGDSAAAAPATQPAGSGQSVTASQVNVNDAGTVEIHVNDASLVEVLRMLSLQSQRNIIASKEVHGTITANLYDVTVKEALDAILHANGYDYREKGNFIYVYTTKEIQELEQASRVKKTEVFRLYYTPAANAVNLLKPVLSNDAQVALTTPAKAGLTSGSSSNTGGDDHAGDDLIVVTDYADNLAKARQVLREVDRRPQQVLVEATVLQATLTDNNALGINFTVLGGVNFSALSALGATIGSGSGSSTGSSSGSTSGSSGTAAGPTGSQAVNSTLSGAIVDQPTAAGVVHNGYINAAVGGNGLNLGVITNNVGVFVQALEGITDTTVLANPKVLVLNKQQGEVHVGDELGYKTSITTDTLTSSTVQFLDTGTRLIFRPYIGDNGYIRLEVHPEDSSGSLDVNGNPSKTTTEVTSNLMVKDGRTVVIGGLFRDATTRIRSQVPFLGSLPGLGPLFRQQTDATRREEIIILLTPHIVKDMDQYSQASEEEQKYAERLEVGARRGLMPWGRERLAESWYEMAVREMNKPHPNRQLALWHLNCAIQLNPMFGEAMELRAQVTGKEVTATDNSTIRTFLKRQVLAERANPTTEPALPSELMIEAPTARADDKVKTAPAPAAPAAAAAGTAPTAPATQPVEAKLDDASPATTQPATASTEDPADPVEPALDPVDDME